MTPADDSPNAPGASGGAGAAGSSGIVPPTGERRLTTGDGYVVAYTRHDTSGEELFVDAPVFGRFAGGGLGDFEGPSSTVWVKAGPWHSWGEAYRKSDPGSPISKYAIGKEMLLSIEETGLSEAHFSLKGGGQTDLEDVDITASCTFASSSCTIVMKHDNGLVRQFDATTNAGKLAANAPDGSKLRGAFTCAESCARGSLPGFGLVLAWTDTAASNNAAALPAFAGK